jgi:hypothetical protein
VYLQKSGYDSVEDVHIAFANKSRIGCIVKMEKLLRFPTAMGLKGLRMNGELDVRSCYG